MKWSWKISSISCRTASMMMWFPILYVAIPVSSMEMVELLFMKLSIVLLIGFHKNTTKVPRTCFLAEEKSVFVKEIIFIYFCEIVFWTFNKR